MKSVFLIILNILLIFVECTADSNGGKANGNQFLQDDEISLENIDSDSIQYPLSDNPDQNNDGSSTGAIYNEEEDSAALKSKLNEGLPVVDISKLPLFDWKTVTPVDFWFESLMLSLLAGYLLNYSSGLARNKQLARAWLEMNYPTWKSNFFHVGDDKGHKLAADGPRDFVLFATGRVSCRQVFGKLRYLPRHDLLQLAMGLWGGVKKEEDQIVYEVEMDDSIDSSKGVVFGIFLKKDFASVKKRRWDINQIAKKIDFPGFPRNDYALVTDCPEFATALWRLDGLKLALADERLLVQEITISDLPDFEPGTIEEVEKKRFLVRLVFRIPELQSSDGKIIEAERQSQETHTNLVMNLIDSIAPGLASLSKQAVQRSLALREAVRATVLRKDQEKRKLEMAEKKYKEKFEREQNIVNLSPKSQRREEEKIRKEELKKGRAKRTKKI